MEIKSPKLAKFVEQAEALGLVVTIEKGSSEYTESYRAIIARPQVEGSNMLAAMYNHEFLSLHAHRIVADGKPRAFKMHATSYPIFGKNRSHKISHIEFILKMWADDVQQYNDRRANKEAA